MSIFDLEIVIDGTSVGTFHVDAPHVGLAQTRAVYSWMHSPGYFPLSGHGVEFIDRTDMPGKDARA
jgi:hypothetical protein